MLHIHTHTHAHTQRYTTSVLQSASALERAAYEFACDNYDENVVYFEVRFAPQLHCSAAPTDGFGIIEVLQAVNKGLARAREEYNTRLAAEMKAMRGGTANLDDDDDGGSSGSDDDTAPSEFEDHATRPYFEYGIIVCAMRAFTHGFSRCARQCGPRLLHGIYIYIYIYIYMYIRSLLP